MLFFATKPNRVLLFRRDEKPTIRFPGHVDILGGHVEPGETPERAIVREMAEELEDHRTGEPFQLKNQRLFKVYTDEWGTEQHIFIVKADFELDDVRLKEGRELVWLREDEVETTPLAFGFNGVVAEFFEVLRSRER